MEQSDDHPAEPATGFEAVLRDELATIGRQRRGGPAEASAEQSATEAAHAMHLAGLAFSGGGIRSATFNLGFIQGLAERRALHLFDYLSTVSGGGYIGAWLSAYWYRQAKGPANEAQVAESEPWLQPQPKGAPGAAAGAGGFPPTEIAPVSFVRRYANYLTPRLGLSGDTLALAATMVRNVVVMQLLLISFLLAAFSLQTVLIGIEPRPVVDAESLLACLSAPAAVLLAVLALGLCLLSQSAGRDNTAGQYPNKLIVVALLMAMASGVFAAFAVRLATVDSWALGGGSSAALALGYLVAWGRTLFGTGKEGSRRRSAAFGAAATLAALVYLGTSPLAPWIRSAQAGYVTALAPLAAIAGYSLVITIHLALAGSALSEQLREWWARAGGVAAAMALAWGFGWAVLLLAPPLLVAGAYWSIAGGGLWAAITWVATKLANGAGTGGSKASPWQEAVTKVGPWAFVIGLVGLVALAYAALLPSIQFGDCQAAGCLMDAVTRYQQALAGEGTTLKALAIGLVTGALFLVLLACVDLNLFSAHALYTNRLARTFLGASRGVGHSAPRMPNAFTGFDADDDLTLRALAGQRPVHLINGTLNLTGGADLGWQTRRGASFVFSPAYCGYSACSMADGDLAGYRPTAKYAGGNLSLATAVAASGAAVSPNMGFHTSTAVAALLTAFNLRLGRWCPNPRQKHWQRREPPYWSAGPLLSELFGATDADGRWLNITDGGHFENLGLYELIRRRVALIVVTDVAADPDCQFDDLAMAVRKVAVDFGVRIDIDPAGLDAIRPRGSDDARYSEAQWACGRIHYPDRKQPDEQPGYLIYVKSSMPKDAPIDIRQYRDANRAFPQQSTADQWFDENQFEAYRHLGQFVAESLFKQVWGGEPPINVPAVEGIEQVCQWVRGQLAARPNG